MDVRTICLGILTRGDATGYEIKKLFEEDGYAFFVEASFGSIYPALNRLTEEGLVSVREEAQTKRPDRKVYSITKAGRRVFLESLHKPLSEDRFRSPFLFTMLFCDLLPRKSVEHMFDDYISGTERELAQLSDRGPVSNRKCERFVLEFGRAMNAAKLKFLREHRKKFKTDALQAAG